MNRLTTFFAVRPARRVVGIPGSAARAGAALITQAELLEAPRAERTRISWCSTCARPTEFAAGHVPGARNVSHDQLRIAHRRARDRCADKQVVLYCRSGRRTLLAEDVLRKAGFKRLAHLEGDYLAWEAGKRPVER